MHIKRITDQIRRDFWAIWECEHCGLTTDGPRGYDDRNFHDNVIPMMECPSCGKRASENYRPLTTKYPEGMQV